jgi:tetratricopeptide (TPR) repeat protein
MNVKSIFWIVLISVLGAMLYIHTYDYGYSADDGIYSHFNRVTKMGLSNWTELFQYGSMNFIEINPVNSSIYRPFTLLTFAIEYEIFGKFDAGNGHILNIVLYGILLVILGIFLVDLLSKKNLPIWVPLLVLLIYAVHPLHTEVVASVKSRDVLLSSIFAFAGILLWIRGKGSPALWRQVFVGILFFFSLISKEESIPLLALVVGIGYYFQGKKLGDAVKAVFPFLISAVVYMGIRAIVLDSADSVYNSMINSVLYGITPGEMLATNFYIYIQYVKLLFFPHPLSWDYSFSQISVQTFSNPVVWGSLIFFGLLIYFAAKEFKSKNLFSFGILFYLTSFSIFANLTASLIIGSNLGERFMFIPSLAFSFLVVYSLYYLSQKYYPKRSFALVGLVLLPVILGFSWKTFDRAKVWESNLTLSASGVETAPKSWRTHMLYGDELRIQGNRIKKSSTDSSKMYFKLAVKELDKGYEIIDGKVGVSHFLGSLAESYLGLGDSTKAIAILEKSISDNPNTSFPFLKLAVIASSRNNFKEAEGWYFKGLKAPSPDHFILFKGLGALYDKENQNLKSITAFKKALEYRDDRDVRRALGFLYFQEGDEATAKSFFPSDENIDTEEVRFVKDIKLANLAFKKEDYKKAVVGFATILDRFEDYGGKEKYPQFFGAYGESLIETGDTLQAKQYLLKAYELNRFEPVICTNLGVIAFFYDKNYQDAERFFKESIDSGVANLYSAYVNLGSSQIMAGKEEDAIITFEKALNIRSTRTVVGNLYLLNKSLGNTGKMNYYLKLLRPTTVSQ